MRLKEVMRVTQVFLWWMQLIPEFLNSLLRCSFYTFIFAITLKTGTFMVIQVTLYKRIAGHQKWCFPETKFSFFYDDLRDEFSSLGGSLSLPGIRVRNPRKITEFFLINRIFKGLLVGLSTCWVVGIGDAFISFIIHSNMSFFL